MAVDVTRLAQELGEFEKALHKHSATVDSEMKQLERHLSALRHAWGGRAGRDFNRGWDRTERAFNDYVEGSRVLVPVLRERIEALKQVDASLDL